MASDTISLTEMYKDVMHLLPGCPQPLIDRYAVEAWNEFLTRTNQGAMSRECEGPAMQSVWQEDLTPITTRDGVSDYDYGSYLTKKYARIGRLLKVVRDDHVLSPINEYEIKSPHTIHLVQEPSSDTVNDITLTVSLFLKRDAKVIDRCVYDQWYEAPYYWLLWRTQSMSRKTWSNMDDAAMNYGRYKQLEVRAINYVLNQGTHRTLQMRPLTPFTTSSRTRYRGQIARRA